MEQIQLSKHGICDKLWSNLGVMRQYLLSEHTSTYKAIAHCLTPQAAKCQQVHVLEHHYLQENMFFFSQKELFAYDTATNCPKKRKSDRKLKRFSNFTIYLCFTMTHRRHFRPSHEHFTISHSSITGPVNVL